MAARTTNSPTTVVDEFLRIAADRDITIMGTVPSGAVGGGASNVTWQDVVPTIPGILTELIYDITFSVTLTIGTSGQSATVSPFAPYSAWANQLTLGGAPPWPLTELTPWWLDEITSRNNWDPAYVGLGNNASPAGLNLDLGDDAVNYGTAPGTTHTATVAGEQFTDTFTFRCRIRLQQKRGLLYGAIPMGDPENKIRNITQLIPLIGNNPEQNLYINAGSSCTAALASAATVKASYKVRYIDLLPSSDTNIPLPAIQYGVQLNANSQDIASTNHQSKIYHRDSMAYLKIMHLLINSDFTAVPTGQQRASYFALWDTQEQKSARWEFDTAQNTFHRYFDRFHEVYRRYPPTGFYVADFVSGDDPNVPGVTPYNGIMSPDANYAEAFNVAVTPAMTTTLTVPSSATWTDQGYVRIYSKGLVGVSY